MKVIANQNETLDAICYRIYGKTNGIVEAVLNLNPGLVDFGEIIPYGTEITLPDKAPKVTKKTINLWD